mmetsp:Transcript_37686/g.100150  ORF Transcript_37686/g.100150 Transcript_37686/m.100150 type:complete len:167 (-) Transcript_37686:1493-1993(-)
MFSQLLETYTLVVAMDPGRKTSFVASLVRQPMPCPAAGADAMEQQRASSVFVIGYGFVSIQCPTFEVSSLLSGEWDASTHLAPGLGACKSLRDLLERHQGPRVLVWPAGETSGASSAGVGAADGLPSGARRKSVCDGREGDGNGCSRDPPEREVFSLQCEVQGTGC